jgi:hypothetical protein
MTAGARAQFGVQCKRESAHKVNIHGSRYHGPVREILLAYAAAIGSILV